MIHQDQTLIPQSHRLNENKTVHWCLVWTQAWNLPFPPWSIANVPHACWNSNRVGVNLAPDTRFMYPVCMRLGIRQTQHMTCIVWTQPDLHCLTWSVQHTVWGTWCDAPSPRVDCVMRPERTMFMMKDWNRTWSSDCQQAKILHSWPGNNFSK